MKSLDFRLRGNDGQKATTKSPDFRVRGNDEQKATMKSLNSRARGNDRQRAARDRASEITLGFLLLHRRAGVVVDHATLALGRRRQQHFADDRGQRVGTRLDRARQRIAAERAEAHAALLWLFAVA